MDLNVPNRRFKQDITAQDVIAWLGTHRYIYFRSVSQTIYLRVTSKVKRWKRDPNRFAFSVEDTQAYRPCRYRITNEDLYDIRIPNAQWHHGVSATVKHAHELVCGYHSYSSRGYLKRYGVWDGSQTLSGEIRRTYIQFVQSNGFLLDFPTLERAVAFARRENMTLVARHGERTRVLNQARPYIHTEYGDRS